MMVAAAAGSLWYLVVGTISSVVQLGLLATGGRARRAGLPPTTGYPSGPRHPGSLDRQMHDCLVVCRMTQTLLDSGCIREGWRVSSDALQPIRTLPRRHGMPFEPVQHTIVAMDVAGSGRRDDLLQLRMRADLRQIIAETLAAQSLDLAALHHTDLGDGIRLIVPPGISPVVLLDPFVPNLARALRRHRKAASDPAVLRLRVALHTGLLHADAGGWAGAPLVTCTRMLDAAPVRRVLAADDHVDLVLVVSEAVYQAVVRHGYGLDPATFHPVRIAEKETVATVWIHAPGYRMPPGLDQQPPPAGPSGPEDTMADPDRRASMLRPPMRTPPAAERSQAGAVFHVHAKRDAYTAQEMTVTHYDGAAPESTP
jgi:hypothetical protein